jgi:hypothetical protein
MYIYTFLLRTADTITFQNIDLSSWDNLYIGIDTLVCTGLYASVRRVDTTCFQVEKVYQYLELSLREMAEDLITYRTFQCSTKTMTAVPTSKMASSLTYFHCRAKSLP